MHYSDYTPV